MFDDVARRFIHHQCGGVPRLINSMCDTALVYGYAEEAKTISAELVYDMALERVESGLFGAGLIAHFNETLSIEQRTGEMKALLDTARSEVQSEREDPAPVSTVNS